MNRIFSIKSFVLFCILLFIISPLHSQNCDWDIEIAPSSIIPSLCSKSGGFTVTLTGPDAPGLSSVAYSALGPVTVNPNSNPVYNQLASGTYTVIVTAICPEGEGDTRSKTVIVPGDYIPPSSPSYTVKRNSLSCGAYGQIQVNSLSGSSTPYKIKIINKPDTYKGPVVFTTSGKSYLIDNLNAGVYSFMVEDDCNTGTTPFDVTIKSLALTDLQYTTPLSGGKFTNPPNYAYSPCNIVQLNPPYTQNSDWIGYFNTGTPLEYSIKIDGGIQTDFQVMGTPINSVLLPPGKTIKDYYSSPGITNLTTVYIRVKSNAGCGNISGKFITESDLRPSLNVYKAATCTNFKLTFSNYGNLVVCYPVNVNVKKNGQTTSTNHTVAPSQQAVTGNLEFGSYTITYTTADNYTWTEQITMNAPTSNPYSLTIYTDAHTGIHKRISSFRIQRKDNSNYLMGTRLELVDAPPGYTYSYTYPSNSSTHYHDIVVNQNTNSTSEFYHFIPGYYKWKITDACDTYYIDTTILLSNVYQYTLDLSDIDQDCNSIKVKPKGTYTYRHNTSNAYFKIISGPEGYPSDIFSVGQTVTLTTPGTYQFTAIGANWYAPSGLNKYSMVSDVIVYAIDPIVVDITKTQGFACVGAADNEGQISIRAKGGAGGYTYYLYLTRNDAESGTNLIASNTLGDFPPDQGYNLKKDQTFFVKMTDQCGRYAIQAVTILNLKDTKLVSANKTRLCTGEELRLSAIVLPAGNYSWSGPQGFSAPNNQFPIISNISESASGYYIVTIQSSYCHTDSKDSILIQVDKRPSLLNIPADTSICLNSTPQPFILTPDANCFIQWYHSDGMPFSGTPPLNPHGSNTYWVNQIHNTTHCESTKQKITIHILNTCVIAVNDTLFVFECEKATFDPLANDLFKYGNDGLSLSFGSPGKGIISTTPEYIYTNTSCSLGKDEFPYTVCIHTMGSCSTAKVNVNILSKPEIIISNNCSSNPYMETDLDYDGSTYIWEKSANGISDWTPLISGNRDSKLMNPIAGYYRIKVKVPGFDEFYTTIRKLLIKSNPLPGGQWIELTLE